MPKIILPNPHPGQRRVQQEARRFNWLSAGRRWRKTTLLMPIGVEMALNGKDVFWGAPTFDQVRIGWHETYKAAGGVARFTQQRMTADFPSGGKIIYRSLDDPDNARGHTADLTLIDETGDVKASAWYEVLRATMIDTGGELWAVGTPKGRNWFWREWMAAKDRPDSMSWQIPTVGCEIIDGKLVRVPHPYENPDIPFEEIKNAFDTLPIDIFRQEYLAEFLEHEGVVFRNIAACMNAVPCDLPLQHKGHNIVVGVDWGKQNDFTAISVGCATCKKEIAIDRFNQIDYHFQRGRIAVLWNKFKIGSGLVETNSIGEPNLEELQRSGIWVDGFETTGTTKPPLIENLALILEKEEWQFINDQIWTGELEAYERKISPTTGRSSYNAPEGMHDDTVIARALMVRAAEQGSMILFEA